ncbi:MAG: tRNA lysidine(34) synthetase TilS [Actinomycetota bacterium]
MLDRCTFPAIGSPATVALSGGPDSSALAALAVHHGLRIDAVHVHHGLRSDADRDAQAAADVAERLGVRCRVERVHLSDGPNLEERARQARVEVLGLEAMTGHTLDDQAETVVLALLRGAGARGLAAMRSGHRHPILGLRRSETRALCDELDLRPVDDPTNDDPRFRRNRVRHEIIPLLDDVAERDVSVLLARAARWLREDDDLLDSLADDLDPTDAATLVSAPRPVARRAIRRWLAVDGRPPDSATVERVIEVAAGTAVACDAGAGRRVARTGGRLRLASTRRDGPSE